jgi:hypothetical protein
MADVAGSGTSGEGGTSDQSPRVGRDQRGKRLAACLRYRRIGKRVGDLVQERPAASRF